MKVKPALLAILLLALLLRLLFFGSLTFFYDQARDAIASLEIWRGDPLKILGPQTDFVGLYHGPLYWYLISPVYFVTEGSVWAVRLFLILVNLASLCFIYHLTQAMFKQKSTSLLACFLFAVSFEAIQYARWLSNPAPALVTSTISFWALYHLLKNKRWAIAPLLISWALSFQFQFFLLYQLLVFLIIWLSLKGPRLPSFSRKSLSLGLFGSLFIASSYFIAELKFNFTGTKTLLSFFKTQTLFGDSFVNLFQSYLDQLVNLFFLNLWGVNLFLAGLFTILTLALSFHLAHKTKYRQELIFLLLWILSPIIINLFTGPKAHFITLGILPGIIILTAYLLTHLKATRPLLFYLALIIITLGNLNLILTKNREGEVLFTVQKQMILRDELKVIDWVYQQSAGQPFRLNTVTSPLFINTTWAMLFNWYGRSHYGYMPIWWGETQVDVPGSKITFAPEEPATLHFLIIEPLSTADDFYLKAIKSLENTRSEVIQTEHFGFFTVEKRTITTPRIFTAQDVFSIVKTTDLEILKQID